MFKDSQNSIEAINSPEKYGRNINLKALFLRHGEKVFSKDQSHTGLTEGGRQMASNFGAHLTRKDAIKGYASDTGRTIDTVILAVNESPTDNKLTLRVKDDLLVEYDENGQFMTKLFAMKKQILGPDFENVSDDERKNRLHHYYIHQHDIYLNYGDKRPDAKTASPLETAAKIADRVYTYINMADHLKSGSQADLLNATHDWAIAAFLKEILIRRIGDKEVRGFQSIEEIGGPIRFTEHFGVSINIDDKGNKIVELEFRNEKYPLDLARLQELVEIRKNLQADKSKR